VRYVRAAVIFVFGSLLAIAIAGIIGTILHVLVPAPGLEFIVAGGLALTGFAVALAGAIRSLRHADRYNHCPACASPVLGGVPGPDGAIRCPACGQWLGSDNPT